MHSGIVRNKGGASVESFISFRKDIRKNIYFYAMLVIPFLYYIIFRYGPLYGIIIAFRRYVPGGPVYGTSWVGFKYFNLFLRDSAFWQAFTNNIILSVLNIIISFPIPIILALLINEVRNKVFKRFIQTVSYLPKFISMVVVVGMLKELLSPSMGIINTILKSFGSSGIFFMNEPGWFRTIYIGSDIWQFMGWNAIIYIAALANVDVEQYDAAAIDGASRFKQMLHVTIPGIAPTIIITLILAVGNMLMIGFEKILLMYNPNIQSTADIISTYVYRVGIEQNNYSYATAMGLFESIIGFILVWGCNYLSRKFSETSLW